MWKCVIVSTTSVCDVAKALLTRDADANECAVPSMLPCRLKRSGMSRRWML